MEPACVLVQCSGAAISPAVPQRFAHQSQLRLIVSADRNARRVNLGEARIGERGAPLVGAPDRSSVRALRVGRQVKHVAISTGGEDHGFGCVRFDRAGDEVARDDAPSHSIYHDEIQHLGAREHHHAAAGDLAFERLIRAEQELLSGLPARVKGP